MTSKNNLILGLIFYFSIIALGHLTHGTMDAVQRIHMTESIVLKQSVVTDEFGPIKYGPLQSIIMVPPYVAGYTLGKMIGYNSDEARTVGYRFCAFTITPIAVVLICLIYLKLLMTFKLDLKISLLSTFLLFFGTLLLPYSKLMFTEPVNALFFILIIFFIEKYLNEYKTNQLILIFIFAGCLTLNNLIFAAQFLFVLGFLGYLCYKQNRLGEIWKQIGIAGLIFIIVSAIWFSYNFLRYGSWVDAGYQGEWFLHSVFYGLYGFLFSIGRGLIFYSPLTVLSLLTFLFVYPKLNDLFKKLLFFSVFSFVFYLLLYSKWHSFEGGWCWGPRFLIPFIPILHLAIPVLLQKFKQLNPLTKICIAILVLFSIMVNSFEYINVWGIHAGATFTDGKTPYWYTIFHPYYSPLFNSWDAKIVLKRLAQFIPVGLVCYYFSVEFMYKRLHKPGQRELVSRP